MVTHGAASDPFWAAIKEGADEAAAEAGVDVVYRAPDTFDLAKMAALVDGGGGGEAGRAHRLDPERRCGRRLRSAPRSMPAFP